MDETKTYLDKLIGEQGFRADIKANIEPKSIPLLAGSIIIAIVIGHFMIEGIYILAGKSR